MGTKCAKCFNKLSLPRNKLRIWIFLNDVTDVEDLNLDGLDDEVEITFSSSSQWRGHPKNELAKNSCSLELFELALFSDNYNDKVYTVQRYANINVV